VFEELCREWVYAGAALEKLDFQPEEVGAYWGRRGGKGVQLDVVAASRREKRLLIGEAKWGQGRVSRKILTDLVARSQRMPQVSAGWSVEYALFAREGYTPAAQEAAGELGAHLMTLEEMERDFAALEG
jgi:hypothetical protein